MIESLTALLTPVIVVIAVYIAYQQWQTNQQRLKIDLYDRRLSVYKAVTKYLNAVLTTLHPTLENLFEFHRSTAEADFLFGPDIRKYLDDLYKHGVQLQRWKEERQAEKQDWPADYDHHKVVEGISKESTWFVEQPERALRQFKKHLTPPEALSGP